MAFGTNLSAVRQAVRLHQQLIILLQTGVAGGPVQAVFGKGIDRAGLDTFKENYVKKLIGYACRGTALYGLSDSVGRLKNVAKMLSGIDAKEYINENPLPLDADRAVKVLSEKTGSVDNFQNDRLNSELAPADIDNLEDEFRGLLQIIWPCFIYTANGDFMRE